MFGANDNTEHRDGEENQNELAATGGTRISLASSVGGQISESGNAMLTRPPLSSPSAIHTRTPSMSISAMLDSPTDSDVKREPQEPHEPREPRPFDSMYQHGQNLLNVKTETKESETYGPQPSLPHISPQQSSQQPQDTPQQLPSLVTALGSAMPEQPPKSELASPPLTSSRSPEEPRQAAFITQFNGSPTFSLAPVQFDPVMDRGRQNVVDSPPLRAEDAVARLKKPTSTELEASPLPDDKSKKKHHHHHHHYHHHHHRHTGSSAESTGLDTPLKTVPATIHPQVTVDNLDVLDSVKNFPRPKLGSLVYEPMVYYGSLLPRLEGKENTLLQIRIPRVYLNKYGNEAVVRRMVWGTDVYSDDSDVVAALYHCGFLKAESTEDVRNTDDNKELEKNTEQNDATGHKEGEIKRSPHEGNKPTDRELSFVPAAKLPKEEIGDCIVTLLLLPKLTQYRGSYRNGIYSRSWLTQHDGISYKIEKIEYIDNGEAEVTPYLKKRRLTEWNSGRQTCIEENVPFRLNPKRAKEIREKQLALGASTNANRPTSSVMVGN